MQRAYGVLVLLLGGCFAATPEPTREGEVVEGIEDVENVEEVGAPPVARAADAAPAEPGAEPPFAPVSGVLECVSATSQLPAEPFPSIWRISLIVEGDEVRATFVRGPLFPMHGGAWSSEVGTTREEVLGARGPATFGSDGTDPVVIELRDDGSFSKGELRLDGAEHDVLCWDRVEVFGSSWASRPLDQPHYDAASGDCVGADGMPTERSVLPLPFVLETHGGECVDLRGVRLNGDDLGNPDISLDLRGADLEGASLLFAKLSGSFEGARLSGLTYGYAVVSGSIDDATELPAMGTCEEVVSTWAGNSVTCRR